VSLVAILFLSVIGGALMVAADQLSVGKKNVISHFVCGAATLSLVAPLLFIGTTVLSAVWYDGKISGAMWGIYASVLVLWAALALLTGLRLRRKGQWADMARTERAYMLLAFITISVLAWQVFVGFLYP